MNILDLIPGGSAAKVGIALVGLLLAFTGGVTVTTWHLNGKAAELEVAHGKALLKASNDAKDLFETQVDKLSGVANESKQTAFGARRDAVAAGVAAVAAGATAGQLRNLALDTYASLAACGATAAASSHAGAPPDLVLSDVLRRLGEDDAETKLRGAEAVASLDAAYITGLACQRSYSVIRGN